MGHRFQQRRTQGFSRRPLLPVFVYPIQLESQSSSLNIINLTIEPQELILSRSRTREREEMLIKQKRLEGEVIDIQVMPVVSRQPEQQQQPQSWLKASSLDNPARFSHLWFFFFFSFSLIRREYQSARNGTLSFFYRSSTCVHLNAQLEVLMYKPPKKHCRHDVAWTTTLFSIQFKNQEKNCFPPSAVARICEQIASYILLLLLHLVWL